MIPQVQGAASHHKILVVISTLMISSQVITHQYPIQYIAMFFYTASVHANAYTDSGKFAYFYVCSTGFLWEPFLNGRVQFCKLDVRSHNTGEEAFPVWDYEHKISLREQVLSVFPGCTHEPTENSSPSPVSDCQELPGASRVALRPFCSSFCNCIRAAVCDNPT